MVGIHYLAGSWGGGGGVCFGRGGGCFVFVFGVFCFCFTLFQPLFVWDFFFFTPTLHTEIHRVGTVQTEATLAVLHGTSVARLVATFDGLELHRERFLVGRDVQSAVAAVTGVRYVATGIFLCDDFVRGVRLALSRQRH